MTDRKTISSICFSALLIISAALYSREKTDAQVGVFNLMGGRITQVEYCCNGLKLTITDDYSDGVYTGGDFFISYADIANPTVNYLYYQVFYGGSQWNVGMAFPFAVCIDISSECESSDPVQGGTIIKIGTGLPGGS